MEQVLTVKNKNTKVKPVDIVLICLLLTLRKYWNVFSCEFCEISTDTFSYRTPLVAASVHLYTQWRFQGV